MRAGLPIGVPALTREPAVRIGSPGDFSAAASLALGTSTYALAGGTENMSQSPHVVRGARRGFHFGQNVAFEDSLWTALTDSYGNTPMAITAENLAKKYGITRDECDAFALESQERALQAQSSGYFAEEIVPVDVPGPKGSTATVEKDEDPRAGLSMEKLGKLRRASSKTASSRRATPAALPTAPPRVVMTTVKQAKADGVEWIGRLSGASVVGVDPEHHGHRSGIFDSESVGARRHRRERPRRDGDQRSVRAAGARVSARDGYAAARAAFQSTRRRDRARTPLGASGARLAITTLHDLRRRGGGYGVASACIGGGQGIAAVFVAE